MVARRHLITLFNHSFSKVLLYKANKNFRFSTSTQNNIYNVIETGHHDFKGFQDLPVENKAFISSYCNKNYVWSPPFKTSGSKNNLLPNPHILFLRNINTSALSNKMLLLKKNSARSHNFSTSTNNSTFWNKLKLHENLAQVPMKLFTHKAEVEHLVVQGVGWAGQPVVKRIHPILPEVYGDISDIFNSEQELSSSSKDYLLSSEMETPTEASAKNESIEQLQNSEIKGGLVSNKQLEKKQSSVVQVTKSPEVANTQDKDYDPSPVMNDNVKGHFANNDVTYEKTKHLVLDQNKIKGLGRSKSEKKILINADLLKKANKIMKKGGSTFLKDGVIIKNAKKKIRKKTKVCKAPSDMTLNITKIKGSTKKKNKVKAYGISKKTKLQPQLILNQRANTQSFTKNVLLMENRQLKTDSTLNHPTCSEAKVKEIKSKKEKKINKKAGLKKVKLPKENPTDDCICPVTEEVKIKRSTKICGEAAEGEKKKIKKWKQKMCLVETKVKHKRRTFVCPSKIKKDKRQRQLPKCVIPEKKVAPRVLICPPKLIDELKESKRCEKQVEEVKIRKRTIVCKPVIIYGKEEAKIEKSICIETRHKTVKSRHTKICPPPDKNNTGKKQLSIN